MSYSSFRKIVIPCVMIVSALLILPLTASYALAEDEFPPTGMSIGGRATYYNPKDSDGNWYGGAQIRFHLSRVFALEGSADYRRNTFDGTSVKTYPVQASLLIYFIPARISPFILGGGGWYYSEVKGPGGLDETQHRFGWHAGGGLQLFLTTHFSIDATYRHIWVEKISSQNVALVHKDYNDNGYMITSAINFHF